MQDAMADIRPQEKLNSATKVTVVSSASSDRPYVCPFAGCEKAYIHEYKLNLHLRKEHPGHNPEEGYKLSPATIDHWLDELNEPDALLNKYSKRGKTSLSRKLPPSKVAKQRGSSPTQIVSNDAPKRRARKELDEDSEETEEDQEEEEEEDENGWRYLDANRDDEETEDED